MWVTKPFALKVRSVVASSGHWIPFRAPCFTIQDVGRAGGRVREREEVFFSPGRSAVKCLEEVNSLLSERGNFATTLPTEIQDII